MNNRILTLCLNPSIDIILLLNTISVYSKNIIEESHICYGGKGINVAYALGKLSASVIATGFTGKKDEKAFSIKLSSVGVKANLISVGGQTRRTYKIVESASGIDTEFNEKGFTVLPDEQTRMTALLEYLLQNAEWLVLTGSLPPGIPDTFYESLTRQARSRAVKVCLDASGVALHTGARAKPDILRINRFELGELVGADLSDERAIVNAIKETVKSGISNAAVSLGADGVIAAEHGTLFKVHSPAVDVKSLTGAGDAMTAGIIYQLSQGTDFQESTRFGAALATASVLRFEPGDFDPEDLRKILQETVIEPVN